MDSSREDPSIQKLFFCSFLGSAPARVSYLPLHEYCSLTLKKQVLKGLPGGWQHLAHFTESTAFIVPPIKMPQS
jgi:hypothetical protein